MPNKKFYKIRDKNTGLYSTGGAYPHWSAVGKMWSGIGPLKNHFNVIKDYKGRGYYKQDIEIVEYEYVELAVHTVDELLAVKK